MIDTDTTVHTLYGQQMGGRKSYNQKNWTRSLSPAGVNEVRGGWHRFSETEEFGTSDDPKYDIAGKMGLPLVSRASSEYGSPSIFVRGSDGGFSMYDLQRQIGVGGSERRAKMAAPGGATAPAVDGRDECPQGGV